MKVLLKNKRLIAILLIGVLLFASLISCKPKNNVDADHVVIPDTTQSGNPGSNTQNTKDPVDSDEPINTPEDITVEPTEQPTPEPEETATPAPTQSADPTPTSVPVTTPPSTGNPSGGNVVSIGTASMPARFTMPTDLYGVSASACEQWFSDAVFVGDSLTLGWQNYINKMMESNSNFFGRTHFLCSGSYGVGHAFDPISDDSLHPRYQGEQHFVWDSIQMMGANKVFILLGLNDLSIYGVDGTFTRYCQLIDNILSHRPGAQIFIISDMYMYRGSERERLNNRNLYLLNQRLAQLCRDSGYEFINIASHLIDENGFVPDQYSSDHYVHQTYAAYAIWADILRSVAARHIQGLPPIVFSMP